MTPPLTPRRVRATLLAIGVALCGLAFVRGHDRPPPPRTEQAWGLDEALAQLKLYPRDPYLQYVALQLARRDGRLDAVASQIDSSLGTTPAPGGRREQIDLFSAFSGALAVQESLQLDTMRRLNTNRPDDRRLREIIDVVKLTGPTIHSHPWTKMLGDKKPDIGPLARRVPEDFYLVEFRSVARMLDLIDAGDLWGLHLFSQAQREARTQQIGERLRQQLAVQTNRLLRPVYDAVVEEVGVTGSDLYLGEGSDVTLLFRTKQPEVFKTRMDGFLTDAAKSRRDVKRTEGEYLGVPYVHLSSPDRAIHVFSAYPEPNLHVRSNSKVALRRVLEAIRGKDGEGRAVRRLGDTTEYAYIRTLMPRGAKEEDGFIYLSDPFIRHLVGPRLKLAERRRVLCYNHLRMIGHAALMYRTEFGKAPASLAELAATKCLPAKCNEGEFSCIDGGTYSLSADGTAGVCSHHGHAQNLVPCCENPLAWVTGAEADEYEDFLREYNNYWRTFFDPIAVRVQVTPQRYRVETIVLPLINNSIYQSLFGSLNGTPEPLDALPVSKRNIFTVAGRFNKQAVLKDVVGDPRNLEQRLAWMLGISEADARQLEVVKAFTDGLGNQVGLHVCDAEQMFDLDLPNFLGLTFGGLTGNRTLIGSNDWMIAVMVASLNAPVYVSLPVQDAKMVDRFLDRLDRVLTEKARDSSGRRGFLELEQDCYRTRLKDGSVARGYSLRLWAVKWRFFWARIGDGLYVASKASILEDLAAAKAEGKPDRETTAHAMVRLRPRNWDRVLDDYRLGWAENNREACLRNLGPISSVARAVRAEKPDAPGELAQESVQAADHLYAVHFYCPEGGRYVPAADGKTCSCSVHGNTESSRQPLAPRTAGPLQTFGGLTATLTFLEDGLHAVVILERK
jgi:hypothetical protein